MLHRNNKPDDDYTFDGPCMNPNCRDAEAPRYWFKGFRRRCNTCYQYIKAHSKRGDFVGDRVPKGPINNDGCQNPACREPESNRNKYWRGTNEKRRCGPCTDFLKLYKSERPVEKVRASRERRAKSAAAAITTAKLEEKVDM